jgi:hypothetical protein
MSPLVIWYLRQNLNAIGLKAQAWSVCEGNVLFDSTLMPAELTRLQCMHHLP